MLLRAHPLYTFFFFFNDTATTEIYTLSLHDALPILKGNVHATGRIEIKKDGSVVGNLTTAQIMIEDGADFKGSIEIDRSAVKEPDQNVSARAAAASAGAALKSI